MLIFFFILFRFVYLPQITALNKHHLILEMESSKITQTLLRRVFFLTVHLIMHKLKESIIIKLVIHTENHFLWLN